MIELRHPAQPEYVLDRRHHVRCICKPMKDPASVVSRDHQQGRSMRVDMIRPILRIVLEHEHHCVLPERALGQRLDDSSQREIVVRHVCLGRWPAGTCS